MFESGSQLNLNIKNMSDSGFLQLLVVFSIGLALLTYGYEISNFSLSIDEEIHSFDSGNWKTWISQGRWGMGVLVYIFPRGLSTIPFVPTLVFAIGLGLSSVIFSTVLTYKRVGAITFIGIFVTSPIWLHISEFNTLSWGFSLGLIATAIGVKYLDAGGAKNSVIAGLCISFSLGIYQALFILYLAAVLMICIKKEWEFTEKGNIGLFRRNIPIFTDVFKSLMITFFIYFMMNKSLMYLSGTSTTYLNNFINLSAYENGNAGEAITRVLKQSRRLLLGTDQTFLGSGISSLLLFWIGLVFFIKNLSNKSLTIITKTYVTALSFGVLLLAMSLIIISAGYIPTRALIVFPILYAVISSFVFKYKQGQKILFFIFGMTLFVNICIANSLFYADHVARQRDLVMATRLIDRIDDVGRGVFGEKIPIVIVGQWQHELGGPASRVEIFGASFFEHDGGNPYRIAAYLRLLGCRGLVPLPITAIRDDLVEIESHPSWPAKNAVFRTESAVIVKLSVPSYQQGLALQAN